MHEVCTIFILFNPEYDNPPTGLENDSRQDPPPPSPPSSKKIITNEEQEWSDHVAVPSSYIMADHASLGHVTGLGLDLFYEILDMNNTAVWPFTSSQAL
jgi:hypothetical protein